jgi:hypothetical protein
MSAIEEIPIIVETWQCHGCDPLGPCRVEVRYQPIGDPELDTTTRYTNRECICGLNRATDWRKLSWLTHVPKP